MEPIPSELRLLATLALNVTVIGVVVRFCRRQGIRDPLQIALDTSLIWLIVQYISIGLPGVLGVLSFAWIALTAGALCVGMYFLPRAELTSGRPLDLWTDHDRRIALTATTIAAAICIAIVWNNGAAPVLSNDALTYHLPAAATWLSRHRIGLYETWFYNPANTYSPLAGSMFIAWWMAPMGNDVLARYVEAPPLLILFLATLQLVRLFDASIIVAAIIAIAVVFARPFISQVILAKDDLFVAALFAMLAVGLRRERLRDRFGPWRIGAALGLMFATKFTALFSAPMLLLAADAPVRAGWKRKHHLLAGAIVCVIAGPWFCRNVLRTGNPLFPTDIRIGGVELFHGMFTAIRSARLTGWPAIVETFCSKPGPAAANYYNLSINSWIVLIGGLLIAALGQRKAIQRDPLRRLVLLGPPIGFATFILFSPYGETRFVYPSMVLLFAAMALIPHQRLALGLCVLLAAASVGTAFRSEVWAALLPLFCATAVALLVLVASVELFFAARRAGNHRRLRVLGCAWTACALVVAGYTYVNWNSYVASCRVAATTAWQVPYGSIAEAWGFVRDSLPPGATVTYANSYYTYPLLGFDLDRPLVYAPVRANVRTIVDLGHFESPTTGEEIPRHIVDLTNAGSSEQAWRQHLSANGAQYLFVGRQNIAAPDQTIDPPELDYARSAPTVFRQVFANDAAVIFEIRGL